jgi:hypothetical protein
VLFDADREERAAPTRQLSFERRLGEELRARGAISDELHLDGFDDLMASSGSRRGFRPTPRFSWWSRRRRLDRSPSR